MHRRPYSPQRFRSPNRFYVIFFLVPNFAFSRFARRSGKAETPPRASALPASRILTPSTRQSPPRRVHLHSRLGDEAMKGSETAPVSCVHTSRFALVNKAQETRPVTSPHAALRGMAGAAWGSVMRVIACTRGLLPSRGELPRRASARRQ